MINPDGPNFLLAGRYYDGSAYDRNFYGYYWSSTLRNNTNAYRLYIYSSNVDPTSNANRFRGASVRCVAREKTMQTVDEWGDSVTEGQTITAMDGRDGNTYRVRRLADGKLWMVDNLRLGDSKLKGRTLTPDNTDLNGINSYVLPNSSKDGFLILL